MYELVESFHNRVTRQPPMMQARRIHVKFSQEVEVALRRDGLCHRLEYTGSSYEGVKVWKNLLDPDLEFDLMVIMAGGAGLVSRPIPGKSGFFILKKREATSLESLSGQTDRNGNKLVSETASVFYSKLQKIINNSIDMNEIVKLRMHGPAVQMDVYTDSKQEEKIYSVDFVPTYVWVADAVNH